MTLGENAEAEKRLKQILQKHWSEDSIQLYGQLKTAKPSKQLQFAESFLSEHPDNAVLKLSLARLSASIEQWGQAKDYVEHSLSIQPSVEAYQLLAEIHEQLNNPNTAKQNLQLGIELATTQ